MIDYDIFLNPNNNFDLPDFLNYDNIFDCSYVHFFVLEHCNGEIMSDLKCVDFENLGNYIFGEYIVYAFNHLDNIILEVKKL